MYHNVRCTTCGANVQITKPEDLPERCPACKVYFGDMIEKQGGGTGLMTANTVFDDEGIDTN